MTKILFLGGLYPKEKLNDYIKSNIGVMQNAADALQWSFVEGLTQINGSIDVVNLPYLGSYPLLNNTLFLEDYYFGDVKKRNWKNVGFCNLILWKNISKYRNARREITKWTSENINNRNIIIYAVHYPFLKASIDVKKQYPDLHITLIVPDLPQFMNDSKSVLYKVIGSLNRKLISDAYLNIDSYVLLSKYMVEAIGIGSKPVTVVEGIFNVIDEDINSSADSENDGIRRILYTGTLARRYGVLNLLEAFVKIENPNYRLVICGEGDSRNIIEEYSTKDHRIEFMGQLKRKEILNLQKKASLLVNPRSNEGEFTKYSFPSKTMEYLASGTPTLICKLSGIPDEYYNYCYSIDDMTVNNLSSKIEEILLTDEKILQELGRKARSFILECKNPISQCDKIIEMLNNLNK